MKYVISPVFLLKFTLHDTCDAQLPRVSLDNNLPVMKALETRLSVRLTVSEPG